MLAEWLITLECNYSCPYCYLSKQRKISDNQGRVREILKILKKSGFSELDISGGEPFLAENALVQAVNFCTTHDLRIRSISTNGTIFSSKVVSSLKEVSDFVLQVSLDAATPATYQTMRNSNYFNPLIANVQSFIGAGLEVFLGITVTKVNYKEIAMVIELAEKIGARGVSLGGFIPLGEGSRLISWCLSKKEMEEVFSICKNVSKKIKIIGLGDNSCPAGVDKWCVLPNGDLYPCALLVNFEEGKVGNLFQKDKFPPLGEWLQKFLEFQPPLKCQNCYLPALCYGGCKAALYAKDRSFPENPLPLCTITKTKEKG
ncbi:MAG: radical SAM protein [Patescibacteria group bacterium]|nr:radical SAM protein [Patescibacteria group bacterium]